ncbi:MAG: peptidylprolyl isomerase [Defluviitaleaceae bacterium]|nr:peptidylprolyl isomerase [Defluviitaleaceae bacterium]
MNPIVTLEIAKRGEIKIELYPEVAPNTVNNFISLVKSDHYDGLKFHRVIKGFMIQGGCPKGNGTGGPGYGIEGEFAENGFDNELSHEKGIISMARSGDPNSAGSQFFLMHEFSPHLDGSYAAFGSVIDGLHIVDEIAEVETSFGDAPVEDEIISKATVETHGVEYPEPRKV